MTIVKKTWIVRTVVLALLLAGAAATATEAGCWAEAVSAESPLPESVQEVVLEALLGPEGEYAAYATYAAIIDEYGSVRPFTNIQESESRHIDALREILDRYDVSYPTENPYLGEVDAPDSLLEAAQAGVEAEIANVALYERQLETVSDYPDVLDVFVNLQTASQESHLPAFQRAVARFGG